MHLMKPENQGLREEAAQIYQMAMESGTRPYLYYFPFFG